MAGAAARRPPGAVGLVRGPASPAGRSHLARPPGGRARGAPRRRHERSLRGLHRGGRLADRHRPRAARHLFIADPLERTDGRSGVARRAACHARRGLLESARAYVHGGPRGGSLPRSAQEGRSPRGGGQQAAGAARRGQRELRRQGESRAHAPRGVAAPRRPPHDRRPLPGDRRPLPGNRRPLPGNRRPLPGNRAPLPGDRRDLGARFRRRLRLRSPRLPPPPPHVVPIPGLAALGREPREGVEAASPLTEAWRTGPETGWRPAASAPRQTSQGTGSSPAH